MTSSGASEGTKEKSLDEAGGCRAGEAEARIRSAAHCCSSPQQQHHVHHPCTRPPQAKKTPSAAGNNVNKRPRGGGACLSFGPEGTNPPTETTT
jgi:hypothetical protein